MVSLQVSTHMHILQEALEAATAVHQLVSALHTFSHCLRPLLLSGMESLGGGAGSPTPAVSLRSTALTIRHVSSNGILLHRG